MKAKTNQIRFAVSLNGTATNPWRKYGLTQNPFPAVARHEYAAASLRMQSLGGDPIPHDRAEQYIRERLTGFSEEFAALCVEKFKPGEYVTFTVTFEETR